MQNRFLYGPINFHNHKCNRRRPTTTTTTDDETVDEEKRRTKTNRIYFTDRIEWCADNKNCISVCRYRYGRTHVKIVRFLFADRYLENTSMKRWEIDRENEKKTNDCLQTEQNHKRNALLLTQMKRFRLPVDNNDNKSFENHLVHTPFCCRQHLDVGNFDFWFSRVYLSIRNVSKLWKRIGTASYRMVFYSQTYKWLNSPAIAHKSIRSN